ncbi:MAG: hypothetical protein QXV32_05805 [Conexivisphaerales archaeon]
MGQPERNYRYSRMRTGPLIIATTDGRAFYDFVSLLRKLSLSHTDLLPSEAVSITDSLVLTTGRELSSLSTKRYLLYEELNGDFEHDAILILSRLFPFRKDVLLLGVDPGGVTGIAVLYRNYPVSFRSFPTFSEAVEFIEKMLNLPFQKCILRIGRGDSRGRKIADHVSIMLSSLKAASNNSITIEMVDESGTSKREDRANLTGDIYPEGGAERLRGKSAIQIQKDALAALNIAKRKGVPFMPASLSETA